jgi:hypothetical protein
VFAPWVLGEVARASLVYGTEFNRTRATDDDLLSCCAACQALRDPELRRRGREAVGHFLLRIGGEQLAFQQAVLNDLSRPVALLEQTTPRKALTVATDGWAERRLGSSLQDYVGAAIQLHTGALKNGGTLTPPGTCAPGPARLPRSASPSASARARTPPAAATPASASLSASPPSAPAAPRPSWALSPGGWSGTCPRRKPRAPS